MDEAGWLACTDPAAMLAFLAGTASDRKLRLFAVACCRRVFGEADGQEGQILALVERCADGEITAGQMRAVTVVEWYEPSDEADRWAVQEAAGEDARASASEASASVIGHAEFTAEMQAVRSGHGPDTPEYLPAIEAAGGGERGAHCGLLRDIFRPFRPIAPPRPRLKAAVTRLARAIYDRRQFDRRRNWRRLWRGAGLEGLNFWTTCARLARTSAVAGPSIGASA